MCYWKFSGKKEIKEKNKLFILFYNEECKAICLSLNHGWKWPHGWRRFNLWQWKLRKASHVELDGLFNVWCSITKTINTSHFVWPQACFCILLIILRMNYSWICGNLRRFAKKSCKQKRERRLHMLSHMRKCKHKFIKDSECSWVSPCSFNLVETFRFFI